MSHSNVTRYEGVRPGTGAMSEQEIERMRRSLPDDPVGLPAGHRACMGCGISTPSIEPTGAVMPHHATERQHPNMVEFGRCVDCSRLHDIAQQYVDEHQHLARRVGPQIARERVTSVLFGMAILGREPTGDLGLMLPRMHPAAHALWFSSPLTLTKGLCSPRPWAHVSTGQRSALRRAFAAVLADRVALVQPPVQVRCPTIACALCGVPSVERSAIEVARRGGPLATAQAVWRQATTTTLALGGRPSPDLLKCHLCPTCAAAIDSTGGAIGPTARGQAVVTHLARTSEKRARRLAGMLSDDDLTPRALPAWAAMTPPRVPNAAPFDHLRRVLERL